MEYGREGFIFFARLGRVSFSVVLLLMLTLTLAEQTWANCFKISGNYTCTPQIASDCQNTSASCVAIQNNPDYLPSCDQLIKQCYNSGGGYVICKNPTYCSTQTERDSVNCELEGKQWVDGECQEPCDEQCQCEEDGGTWEDGQCNYVDLCVADRSACERAGGSWSGTEIGRECCSSTCNLCEVSASQYIYKLKRRECCTRSQAPPDPESVCYVPVQSGCGMTTSQWVDQSTNDWECQDPNLSSEVRDRFYEQCFEQSSSSTTDDDEQSSSSVVCDGDTCSSSSAADSTGSSSDSGSGNSSGSGSGGNSSGSGSGGNSSDSGSGNSSGSGSGDGGDGGGGSGGDGGNGSGGGGSDGCPECDILIQIRGLLGGISGDVSDILTCLQVPHLCPALDVDLSPVIEPVNDLNDSLASYLGRIADLIGVSSDSLVSHLDSIVRHIPDSVLDSILKYQKYADDNFDSVIYGMGKGFGKVDSLIDSAVKYFRISNSYDSMYRVMFTSFDSSFNSNMNDLPGRNASAMSNALGYGDTATSSLRADLNAIKDAIDGIGDGLGGDIVGAMDSAWGHGTSKGDSGYGGYGADSSSYNSVLDAAFGSGSASADSAFDIEPDTCTTVDCIASHYNLDSASQAFKDGLDSTYSQIADSSAEWFTAIRQNLKFVDFDSVLLEPLKNVVPNTNSCPEECFTASLTLPFMTTAHQFSYGVCRSWNIGGVSINALLFVRLLLRILTAVCCIYIGLWYIAGRK